MTSWGQLTSQSHSTSEFMSEDLCHSILDYQGKVDFNKGKFTTLLDNLSKKQNIKATKEVELFTLETELATIQDDIVIRKSANLSYSDLTPSENVKQSEVNAKKAEINMIQSDIDEIYEEIELLKSDLSIENNFTPDLIQERNGYIIEKKWSDDNYFDDKELYEDGKLKFDDVRKPKLNIQLSSVNFFQMVEEQRNWDKLYLGDVVTAWHPKIKTSYEVFVTDLEVSDDGLNLTIADYEEIRKDEVLLEKINQSYSSSIDLEMNKFKWNQTTSDMGEVHDLINNTWDATKRRIAAGVKESVEISNRGIVVKNPSFPNEIIIIQSGVIALSEDNGQTWKTAITPSHIVAERLLGKLIVSEKMIIGDADGTFEIKGNKLTIKDREDIIRLYLGEYDTDKFGLKLMNKTGKDVILDENGILQTWQEGRTDNVDETNGLSMFVYLPDNTLSIRQAILNFKLLPFRSYSKSTAFAGSTTLTSSSGGGTTSTSTSGGGTTVTSASGGSSTQTSTSGGGTTVTSSNGGGTTVSSSNGGGTTATSSSGGGTTQSTNNNIETHVMSGVPENSVGTDNYGNHLHEVTIYGHNHDVTIPNHTHTVTVPNHSHSVTVPDHSHSVTVPSHTHNVSIPSHEHDVTIPSHTHNVTIPNHSHSVEIPSHTHDQVHGIYTSTSATGVGVYINGVDRTSVLGGKFNADQNNLNITKYLTIGQWNEIKLNSDTLGRIDGNVFIQAFMGT